MNIVETKPRISDEYLLYNIYFWQRLELPFILSDRGCRLSLRRDVISDVSVEDKGEGGESDRPLEKLEVSRDAFKFS